MRVRELEAERDALRARLDSDLRASRDRYRALFDSIDEGFCIIQVIFDDEGRATDYRFLEVNAAFAAQTGLENAVGQTMRALLPDHEEHWFEIFGQVARTGTPMRFDRPAAALGRWYTVYAFRVGEPGEDRVGVLFNDVTEKRKTELDRDALEAQLAAELADRTRQEEALREAKEKAEVASRAKSQFLSTISHELRTPLTSVIGLADLLRREVVGSANDRQKELLDRIAASAWHLVSIIDEILTFTRSEAGKEQVRLASVDLADVADGVIEMLRPQANVQGLELYLTGADAPVRLWTDAGKVRQILVNLVGNALRYTECGSVTVDLDPGEEWIELRVRDTGIGIATEQLEDIFEPFVQVESSETREMGGTGLGLAICQRLARLLGGDIEVRSAPGEGSTFTVRLPHREGDAA